MAQNSGNATREYPPVDPTTIAPLTLDGVPDMYNNIPSRFVSLEESRYRGWSTFYDARTCRYGHQAPHYVSNPRLCVDCHRIKNGRTPIGGKAGGKPEYTTKKYAQRIETAVTPNAVLAAAAQEPDASEKRFLINYADLRSIDTAAKAANLTAAQVYARMAWSPVFKEAVNKLEDDCGIKRSLPAPINFEWSDPKRARLLEVFVDTGDIAAARDAILVTPSEFHREIERNSGFSARLEEATPLAMKALEERAIQYALAGNDKLLTKVLTAKMPEYRERVNVEMNVTEKLDDRQLDARLIRLLTKLNGRVGDIIDAESIEVEPPRQIAVNEDFRGDGPARIAQSNTDLL